MPEKGVVLKNEADASGGGVVAGDIPPVKEHLAGTGKNVVELPLGTVGMERTGGLSGRDAADLHVEGMPFLGVSRAGIAAQRHGQLPVETGVFTFR